VSPGGAKTPVPNRLREHRLALGLEQWQVAERIGALTEGGTSLDEHAVSRHERGLHQPRRFYRQLYCQLYRADEAELCPRTPALLLPAAEQPDGPSADRDPVLVAAWDRGGTVEAAVALTGSGGLVERRTFLFLTSAALTPPAHQWLEHEPAPLVSALRGRQVSPALADRLPAMIAELRAMDNAGGGGAVLSLAEHEFAWVSSLLDRGSYDGRTGAKLHGALAELGRVTGFSSAEPVSA
jgi:hypothetical protein